jgi:hypothetical protein
MTKVVYILCKTSGLVLGKSVRSVQYSNADVPYVQYNGIRLAYLSLSGQWCIHI